MNREEYILSQIESKNIDKNHINLNENELKLLQVAAEKLNVSVNEFIYISMQEELIHIEYEKFKNTYDNIIDIYEFGMNIEEYIDTGLTYFVINPNGKHVLLLPLDKYKRLTTYKG